MHESAHEWFGNNITTADIADMWVHESFANYSETLYTECLYGKEAGAAYVIGTRPLVQNDKPVVGTYGVNAKGSGDMYPKGGNMLHTIRQIVDDDEKWRGLLRGLNADVPAPDRDGQTGPGLHQRPVRRRARQGVRAVPHDHPDSGLRVPARWRHTELPLGRRSSRASTCRWPVRVAADSSVRIAPTETWQTTALPLAHPEDFRVDENFYVVHRRVN